eukprot:9228242-Ditylum_brightwellii.AAC.2
MQIRVNLDRKSQGCCVMLEALQGHRHGQEERALFVVDTTALVFGESHIKDSSRWVGSQFATMSANSHNGACDRIHFMQMCANNCCSSQLTKLLDPIGIPRMMMPLDSSPMSVN